MLFPQTTQICEISALIEYLAPHAIVTAISGQRRKVYFRLHTHTRTSSCSEIYVLSSIHALPRIPAGTGAADWAQPCVFYVTDQGFCSCKGSHHRHRIVCGFPTHQLHRERNGLFCFPSSPSHRHQLISLCCHLLQTRHGDCTKHRAELRLCQNLLHGSGFCKAKFNNKHV